MDDVARAAVRASSAASAKPADGDPIPHAPAGHSHAKFFNHAGDLVAWSNREGDIPSGRGGGADVGTAVSDGADAQAESAVRTRDKAISFFFIKSS